MAIKFRKPEQRLQGLKILAYGADNTGKTCFTLSFPKLAVIDTEAKIGVYENNPKFNKNIEAIGDTVNYYDIIDLMNYTVKNQNTIKTLSIDSETNLYESIQVSAMEVEEERAKKKNTSVDDAIVAQRGWGKIKLNNARLRNIKSQASANGITIISIAHKKDITQDINGKTVKIGEKPDLKEGSTHDYDVILRFYKEKNIASGEFQFFVDVEKDTTETYKIGSKIENMTYDNWKDYIERNQKGKSINASYDKAIESTMETMKQEAQDFDALSKEFVDLYKKLSEKDSKNKDVITQLLKDNNVDSYKNPEAYDGLKRVVEEMRNM